MKTDPHNKPQPPSKGPGSFGAAGPGLLFAGILLLAVTGCQQTQERPAGRSPAIQQQQQAERRAMEQRRSGQRPGTFERQNPQQPAEGLRERQSPEDSMANAQARLQKLQSRIQKIGNRLSQISRQAEQNQEVAQALKDFQNAVFAEMKNRAPEREEEIDRYAELTWQVQGSNELRKAPKNRSGDFEKKVFRYNQLRKQLLSLQEQVLQSERLQQLHQVYEDRLLAEMKNIDSRTEALIEERDQLLQEMEELQKRVRQQYQRQQPRQQAPQTRPRR